MSRVVSLILHPIFIPLLFGLYAYPFFGSWFKYHLLVAIFLVVIPGILTAIWLYLKKENNLFVVEQTNRIIPLGGIIIGIAFLAVGSGAFLPEGHFPGFLVLNVFLLVFLSLLITFFWKISLHGIGWGAATGAAMMTYVLEPELFAAKGLGAFPSVMVLVVCISASVLIFPARLGLKAHSPAQMIVGWLFGFGMMVPLTAFAVLPL